MTNSTELKTPCIALRITSRWQVESCSVRGSKVEGLTERRSVNPANSIVLALDLGLEPDEFTSGLDELEKHLRISLEHAIR